MAGNVVVFGSGMTFRRDATFRSRVLFATLGTFLLASSAAADSRAHRIATRGAALLQVAATSASAHLKAISEALSRGNVAEADNAARKFLDALGDRAEARLAAGVAFAQHGHFPQAATHFARARQLAPNNYTIDYNLGLALFRSEQHEEAAAVLRDTLAYRDTAELRHLLADVYENSGRYIEALREYEYAVRLEPGNETYWFALAYELLKHRTHDGAATTLQAALQRFPTSFRLHLALGITYFARRQYGQAVTSFLTASDLEPISVGPYRMLAAACRNRGQWSAEVLERFRRLMQVNPKTPWGPYLFGLAREESAEGTRASDGVHPQSDLEGLYRKSIALDSGFAEARYRLGRLFRKQGRLVEAVKQLEAASKDRRDWSEPRYELARAYLQLGKRDAAEREFEVHRELLEDEARKNAEELGQIQQFILLLE